jgi:uncharacterized protein YdeI (YjbR/CyaY-like superfamily)
MLDCNLTEELKWGWPCYTYKKANVLILNGFKAYCGIGFFKGALLSDSERILYDIGGNTQSSRQLRFTNVKEITAAVANIKAYIYEAIEVEKAGLKVVLKETSDFPVPKEFKEKMEQLPSLKVAFESLTPGRQRAYLLHFADAKQSSTRAARVEKYIPKIMNVKGINDCHCGLTKRKPNCDGSHKHQV